MRKSDSFDVETLDKIKIKYFMKEIVQMDERFANK